MPSLQSSSSNSENKSRKTIPLLTWIIRILTGALFLFSGFVKAVDPWGTIYKFNEYLAALGIPLYPNLVLAGVFLLCGLEFLIGAFLLSGAYRRSTPVLALLFMCVMLPLTLWLAVAEPINDCGCFGDVLILTNWQTFWKNVLLTGCILWLLKYNRRIHCIITPAFQWMAFLASSAFILCVSWYGYMIQPMIDFRPFKTGTPIIPEDSGSNESEFIFTYEKDGVKKEFSENDTLPDEADGWKFVSRREIYHDQIPTSAERESETHEFRVWNRESDEDVTDEAIETEGGELLLLIPSLKEISASTTWKINALYDWADAHDIRLAAVIAAHSGNLDEWEDLSMPRYDIYTAEDTSIKELARGNPSVVYLENGIIKWKSSLAWLDSADFDTPDRKSDISLFAHDGRDTLKNFSWIYIAVMAMLVAMSLVPRLGNIFSPLKSKRFTDQS